MSKKRIGFLSYWGRGRGLAYVTLGFTKMLRNEYDVYILKQGTNEIGPEFKTVDVNVTEHPSYIVDRNIFTTWVTKNKLDAIIFNEYKQWGPDPNELARTAKKLGLKVYGYLVMERFKRDQTFEYDRILVPTVSCEHFMRQHRVRNFTYVPYSIDLNEFPIKKRKKNAKFTFFHPGGWGGVHNRKNTQAVVEAFIELDDENTKLVITSQKRIQADGLPDNIEIINKDMSRQELIDMYYKADVVVLPSKWETIGLPILESLAAGVPVITTEAPPMNEFINNALNGYTCRANMSEYPDISIMGADVDVSMLKKKMEMMMNEMTYNVLKSNSRHVVEQIYDLEKNKHYLIDFLEKELIC